MFYRLIKPDWAIPTLRDNTANPKFKQAINGAKIIEGCLPPEDVKVLNELGYNTYWFPNHPSKDIYKEGVKHLSGKHIEVFNYVFIDMDLKDNIYKSIDEFLDVLKHFSVKPTLTVKSGHGVHAYWKINELCREAYVLTQFALIRHFKTDESVWTVLQLMRVPGSLNTKEYQNYKVAEVEESLSTGEIYELNSFPVEIFNISEMDKVKAQNHVNKLDGKMQIQLSENINVDEVPDSFIDIMMDNENIYQLFNNPTEYYGDRSSADMKLTNILFSKDYPKNDTLAVIANTQKALSKGAHRFTYAQATVDKAYVDRTKNKFSTVGEKLKSGVKKRERNLVYGPSFFDCLHYKWAKKQVLGLVAGSGVGKTSVTLKMFKDMIMNNFDNNEDVFVFFSLEMTEEEIMERWISLVGENSPLADRLYVIGNEDEDGEPRNIGLQEVHEFCVDIIKSTGKNIASIAIDHVGIIGKHIDIRKKHTFGVESEQMTGNGDIRTISLAHLCTQVKTLAKMLNTFVILLTQTTKEKGVGYTPIGKDAAFGVSQYENIVDYMITVWQPLMLVQELTEIRFLAWQYAKIRNQHKKDLVKPNAYKLLIYELETGELNIPTETEYGIFKNLFPQAVDAGRLKEKKIETNYSRSLSAEFLEDVDKKLKLIGNKNVQE